MIEPFVPAANAGSTAPDPKVNLPLAIGAGLTAAIVGAAIWAIITITTKYQIGWMAVGVGLLVGFAVGYAGGGRASRFLGAFFALFGCIAGNFLSMVAFAADEQRINLFQALTSLDYQKAGAAMFESFWSTDILFYAIAVYEGYRFSAPRTKRGSAAVARQ